MSAEGLRHEPPRIVFSEEPAVLVTFDGAPSFREVEGAPVKVAVNTSALVLADTRSGRHWLSGGKSWWYEAADPLGPWRPVGGPPPDVAAFAAKAMEEHRKADAQAADDDGTDSASPPRIIVATEPTELVVTEGRPALKPVAGTDGNLLAVDNTESDVLFDVAAQQYYVLLSGRWFRGKSLAASAAWAYVAPDALPPSFAKIPPESDSGDSATPPADLISPWLIKTIGSAAMRAYLHLSDAERDQIAVLRASGQSIGAVATALGRAKSTVSRELRRNALPSGRYSPVHAAGAYLLRRWREAILEKDGALQTFVRDRLAEGWTPEQISGWLKAGNERRLRFLGCETIYAFIYRASQKSQELWRYLTCRHKRRRPRRARPSRDTIKDRVSIHDRPKTVDTRAETGHWEGDLIICKHPLYYGR